MTMKVGARSSKLSRAQVDEVFAQWHKIHPDQAFDLVWVETAGDKDRTTSLRDLGKTDFFTKELDQMLIHRAIRLAIHSAKDLPDPLPQGLCLAVLTKGVDPRDCVVMREGESFESLLSGSVIATSSVRREGAVRSIRLDLCFVDLRGTIAERLEKLTNGEADGVVVALAALIRLKLTHLNHWILPGATVEGQGRIALVCRQEDMEMVVWCEALV